MELRENLLENGMSSYPNKQKCQANLRPKLYIKKNKDKYKRYRRWISWMDFNESIIRYSCYLMRSDNRGLQFGWESKTKKYQYTTKLELKFLMRNMLTLSSSSSVGQKLPEFYLELIKKLTKLNKDLRIDNNFELSKIANMDKTLFVYEYSKC